MYLFDELNDPVPSTLASGAEFSECRCFRYRLWRRWVLDEKVPNVAFIGVNPSVANEHENDRTITRCINFAKSWGYGGMLMLNAFAHIQTNLNGMALDESHVGPRNDDVIKECGDRGDLLVAVWGVLCPMWREEQLIEMLGGRLHCLGRTKDGRPRHPLYMKSDSQPESFAAQPKLGK